MLGGEAFAPVGQGRDLHPHRAERGRALLDPPLQRGAFGRAPAPAEGRRLGEQHRDERVGALGRRDGADLHPRPAMLGDERHQIGIERAFGEEPSEDVLVMLRVQVVDVGLEHRDRLGPPSGGGRGGSGDRDAGRRRGAGIGRGP